MCSFRFEEATGVEEDDDEDNERGDNERGEGELQGSNAYGGDQCRAAVAAVPGDPPTASGRRRQRRCRSAAARSWRRRARGGVRRGKM